MQIAAMLNETQGRCDGWQLMNLGRDELCVRLESDQRKREG